MVPLGTTSASALMVLLISLTNGYHFVGALNWCRLGCRPTSSSQTSRIVASSKDVGTSGLLRLRPATVATTANKSRRPLPVSQTRVFSSEGGSSDTASSSLQQNDPLQAYRNKSNRRDQVISAISGDGGIKVTACTTRNLINDLMMQHTMTEIPTEALGRTLISALLMANGMQDEQVVQITMNADGPLRGIVGIANGKGELRGYVGTPQLGSSVSLTDAVGKGMVQVVKNHPDWPRPYNGITAIRHQDIDRDIGIYLAESEQRSCALAAATSVTGVLCKAAGGYLIEQLPDVDPDIVKKVETNLAQLVKLDGGAKLPTNLLLQGVTPMEMAEMILDGLDLKPLQQLEPKLACECNEGRLFRALRLLPREEVEEILEKEEEISARCHFCGKTYRMTADDVRQRLDAATGDPAKDDEFLQ